MMNDQRRFERYPCNRWVRLDNSNLGNKLAVAIKDVSIQGIGIAVNREKTTCLDHQELVSVHFPDKPSMKGQVRWIREGCLGIEFQEELWAVSGGWVGEVLAENGSLMTQLLKVMDVDGLF